MFSCHDVLSELSNALDGETSSDLLREIERHVAECRTCRVLYDSTRRTLKFVTESGSFELPPSVSKTLIAKIMDRIRSGGPA